MAWGRPGNSTKFALCDVIRLADFSLLGQSYSVLTHEQIVDLLWKDQIQPLLKKRFPQATEDELARLMPSPTADA